jgi:hypothetical protein
MSQDTRHRKERLSGASIVPAVLRRWPAEKLAMRLRVELRPNPDFRVALACDFTP